jgi:hypothetical protein
LVFCSLSLAAALSWAIAGPASSKGAASNAANRPVPALLIMLFHLSRGGKGSIVGSGDGRSTARRLFWSFYYSVYWPAAGGTQTVRTDISSATGTSPTHRVNSSPQRCDQNELVFGQVRRRQAPFWHHLNGPSTFHHHFQFPFRNQGGKSAGCDQRSTRATENNRLPGFVVMLQGV